MANANGGADRPPIALEMTADDPKGKPFSLKRWSRRKLENANGTPSEPPASVPALVEAPTVPQAALDAAPPAPLAEVAPLPPVESLTIDSDFTRFMGSKVDAQLKRQALKQLFRDPRFNVMDGLDVYVGDYSQPDPISPEVVREMVQGRYIFDPPKTRVNEQGAVEDVPPEEAGANANAGEGSSAGEVLPDRSACGRADDSAALAAPEGTGMPAGPSAGAQEPDPAPR